jgi:hypothetical protein
MQADMENTEEIEMLLWDYIDGGCDATERERISRLIAENTMWQQKYDEIIGFNNSIAAHAALEQPSMRFAKNVMDIVATTKVAPATGKFINYNIVKGIAAAFFIVIGGLLTFALCNVNWHSNNQYQSNNFSVKVNLPLDQLSSPTVINTMIAISIVLGLLLADNLLRKRQAHS